MIPCMNQKMRMCLRLLVYIFTSGKTFTLMFKSYILRRITEALSEHVVIKVYVDANHAGTMANRRSHYGIIIYVNNSPIIWYSKRQNTVEASSFGSKFVALRITIEMIEDLRYKLRSFGVDIVPRLRSFARLSSLLGAFALPTKAFLKIGAIEGHRE